MKLMISCVIMLTAILAPMESVNSQAENCSPSYPGICIAPAPPDLDCKDVSYRRFQVLSPDPHRFDGDKNGIGCQRD